MTARYALTAAVAVATLGLAGCGGDAPPAAPDSTPVVVRAIQAGPQSAELTVHYFSRDCSEIDIEPDEGARRIVLSVDQPDEARCSGGRSAQAVSVPLERAIGDRQIVDRRTRKVRELATCRDAGQVPTAIKRSICRVQRRARGGG